MAEVPPTISQWISIVEKYHHPSVSTDLVLAILWQENGPGDRYAMRYEPSYQYFYDHYRRVPLYQRDQSVSGNRIRAAGILGPTEFHSQSQSWGLLQLMGAAARERRFHATYLAELCDPEVNITYGTIHLWEWGFAGGSKSVREALVRWNGAEQYATEVLAKLAIIEGMAKV